MVYVLNLPSKLLNLRFAVPLQVDEDDSEAHPSMELAGELLEWRDIDSNWTEEVSLLNLLLLLPEYLRGGLEFEPEEAILLLLEPMFLLPELRIDLEDVLESSSHEELTTDELLVVVRETVEDDLVSGVTNLRELGESTEADCLGTIKPCPVTIKLLLLKLSKKMKKQVYI